MDRRGLGRLVLGLRITGVCLDVRSASNNRLDRRRRSSERPQQSRVADTQGRRVSNRRRVIGGRSATRRDRGFAALALRMGGRRRSRRGWGEFSG